MKKALLWLLVCGASIATLAQNNSNTLLWRISGKNITTPSYLFGTIHMICSNDIKLSDSLKYAIHKTDQVYLELDMDNMFEMLQAIQKMKMRNDTTLADLLTEDEYSVVKSYFSEKKSMIPFAMLETYKPMLAASTLLEGSFECENPVAMEQLIMQEAKGYGKKIKGLETMAFQLSIFDSIPYKLQAQQLVTFIQSKDKQNKEEKEFQELANAYKNQQLEKLEELTQKDDIGMKNFTDVLLYNRNTAWVKKIDPLLQQNSLLIAVGAGHLPGEKGVINLLRKAGYTVEPVENNMLKENKPKQIVALLK